MLCAVPSVLTIGQAALGALVLARLSRGRVGRPPLRPGAPPPQGTISAVVPARDEQDRLGPCLDGLLGDADLLEVVVVDDRSGDATADLARRAGARVVEGREPPPGWAGKTWALQQGIEAAQGDWVLHLDADAGPVPGLARAMVASVAEHGDDLLSVGPAFRCRSLADPLLHPAFLATIPYRMGPLDVPGRWPGPARALANGQCVLVARERF